MLSNNNIKEEDKDKDIVSIRHPMTYKPLSKRVKKLPSNFFERILILEMNLRNEFSVATLDELILMYTIAVEFYETKEELKAQDYQLRMATLLSDAEILRYISDDKKKRSSLINTNASNSSSTNTNNANTNLKQSKMASNNSSFNLNERTKSQLKLKLNYIQKYSNNNNIQQTLGGLLEKKEEKKSTDVKSIIKSEFNKQREQWTQKLQNKKKIIKARSQFNSPDLTHLRKEDQTTPQILQIVDISLPEIPMPIRKKEEEYDPEVKFKNSLEDKLIVLDNLITTASEENSPQMDPGEEFDLAELPNKFQNIFVAIDEKINGYINNFNAYFYKEIFESFFFQLKKLIDEKYEQYIKISQLYHSQIKEKEFLLNPDKEDEEQENLKQIIESLKEEQEHEIDRIDIKYNSMINEKVNQFKMESFKNNSGLQVIEEQFKLDVYQSISDVL